MCVCIYSVYIYIYIIIYIYIYTCMYTPIHAYMPEQAFESTR